MKKLFLIIIVVISLSSVHSAKAQDNTNSVARVRDPFSLNSKEEVGIEYVGVGVYRFFTHRYGEEGFRDFGLMLMEFRKSHPNLEQESMAPAGLMSSSGPTSYIVTFHEKK